jgi:hypothetical protein
MDAATNPASLEIGMEPRRPRQPQSLLNKDGFGLYYVEPPWRAVFDWRRKQLWFVSLKEVEIWEPWEGIMGPPRARGAGTVEATRRCRRAIHGQWIKMRVASGGFKRVAEWSHHEPPER